MSTKEDSSSPFAHYHKAIDSLSKPAEDISAIETLGWGYDQDKMDPRIDGKKAAEAAAESLDQEMLETLTYLTEGERLDLSIEKVLGRASLDLVALGFAEAYARSSVAVKGRGRLSIEKIMGGSNQKISVPTTLQKIKRKLVGGKEVGVEQEYGQEDKEED